ncbi:MAG: secretin N-terminal domain-containing protein [Candidatus Omnitrophota bacterium]
MMRKKYFWVQRAERALASGCIVLLTLGAPVGAAEPVGGVPGPEKIISINLTEADIGIVFRVLAMEAGVNIVTGPEISGNVTIQLTNVPWQSAFDTIVKTYGYAYEKEGNIFYVTTEEAMSKRRSLGVRTEVYDLKYAKLSEVIAALGASVRNVRIQPVQGTNQIMLTASPSEVESAREIISQVDFRQPQVHIDAKIIRTALSKGENMGVDWGTAIRMSGARRPWTFPFDDDGASNQISKFMQKYSMYPQGQTASESTSTITDSGGTATTNSQDFPMARSFPYMQPEDFTFGTLDFSQFSVAINMLKTRANTKVVSNPRIVVQNHQPARVQAGREIGLPTFERNETTGSLEITGYEPRNDGISLDVTPHIINKKEILLTVKPELTRFLGFQEVITGENVLSPEFETTVAETQVLINSGDTLVIGGLINEAETDSHRKVPYVGDIPLLGWVFKRVAPTKERSETIIFVTVRVADDRFNQEALENWEKTEEALAEFKRENEKFMKYSKMDNKLEEALETPKG